MRALVATLVVLAACGFKGSNEGPTDAAIDAPDAPPDAPSGAPRLLPEVADFGAIVISPSAAATFTVTSSAATQQLATSITGANAADFERLTDGCNGVALPVLASCTITVRFAPTVATGAKVASLRVTGGGNIDLSSMLRGRFDIAANILSDVTTLPFGTVHVGVTSATQTITVRNPGTLTTSAITVAKAGADPTEFTIVSDTCNTLPLAPMSTCTIGVAYAPNGVGARSATIAGTATTGGSFSVTLTGSGEALTIATGPADFGSVTTGMTSPPITLTVTNVAANNVGPLVTSLAGNHPTEFAFGANACNGMTLMPLQTCTIDVQFKPTVIGARNGLVRIMVGSTIIVDGIIQGVGLAPDPISISPTSFAFTATTVGMTSTAQTFTLFNTGTVSTGVLASSLTGLDPTQFAIITATDTCTGVNVPGPGMCTIDVVFKPTTTGAKAASLSLTSTPGGTHTATLTGTGL